MDVTTRKRTLSVTDAINTALTAAVSKPIRLSTFYNLMNLNDNF